ncbi:MAG: isoprenyl transferase [Alphaproteobacteria bacterium]|nr:isoprenyl transferase [Alphaproteobacteria bacterium]
MDNQLKIPNHIAIIMDGNGRWAKSRRLPSVAGHKRGMEAIRRVVNGALEFGISHITLFGFSTENWKRSEKEIGALMTLLRFYLQREIKKLDKKGVRMRFVGEFSRLPKDIVKFIKKAEDLTANNTNLELNIALSYGGRMEIVEATKQIAKDVASGNIKVDEIDESLFSNCLFTKDTPDPDVMIRTSGEMRISNFLLWQVAYSELMFTDTLWPDFSITDMKEAIEVFNGRDRRYGGRKEDDVDDADFDIEAELNVDDDNEYES